MNLYIFSETRRGSVYGVGTYIRELTSTLKNSSVNICVVYLTSEKPQIQSEEIDGIKHWYFPSVISEQRTTSNEKQWELYYRNIVYLLRLYMKDKDDLIFHLNYCQSSTSDLKLSNLLVITNQDVRHSYKKAQTRLIFAYRI